MEKQPQQRATEDPAEQPAAATSSGPWARLRGHLIRTMPRPIVNNASNVVGAIQLVAEGMMFKASGVLLMDGANRSNPLHYIIYPPKNILSSAFGKFKFNGSPKDLLKPSTYVEAVRNFVDLDRATQIDRAKGKLFTNNLSAMSSVAGMSVMFLATVLPDRKESREETDQMANMAHDAPGKYVRHRLAQAINPMCWWTDKRQIAGLGMVAAGTFSFLGGFRQIAGKELGQQYYRRNLWHSAGSAIMTFAGAQLLLAINNQQGWTRYGTTQLARLLTLPGSIGDRFKVKGAGHREQGAGWYFGAQSTMVVKNATASLLGGAERQADGTVIDHEAIRKAAQVKAREDDNDALTAPKATVSQVTAHEAPAPQQHADEVSLPA